MTLDTYRGKRDFRRTPEPSGASATSDAAEGGGPEFVIQKHDASRLHYDFRLEMEGVLRSWAVPKGPSLDPSEKRLAVHVEDHPLAYGDFEGVIPEGQYGGGTVLLWDRGTWAPEGDPVEGYRKGRLRFTLSGEKLRGTWTLVRMGGKNWLLIKSRDDEALESGAPDVTEARPESVASGRELEAIAADPERVWGKAGAGKAAALPTDVRPQLATLTDAAPEGDGWLHEIKLDGYRLLLRLEDGRARLLTRRGKDWTDRFPTVAEAAAGLAARSALLDGEAVMLQDDGTTDFQALQGALGSGSGPGRLAYFAFDLLHLDGRDLTGRPLTERKVALRELLEGGPGAPLRYGDHVVGDGPDFHRKACAMGLEGIVSKRAGAPYRGGRGRDWLKVKCQSRQELVVGGFTEPAGAREGLGALLVGYHEDGDLVYAGKVGTGFSGDDLVRLRAALGRMERKTPPFDRGAPRGAAARGVRWVTPKTVVEVEFTEWTREGHLRHPSFKGVRDDKPAGEVTLERPEPTNSEARMAKGAKSVGKAGGGKAGGAKSGGGKRGAAAATGGADTTVLGVRLTSPDRVLWPDQGVTKAELARHYVRVAERMLPHVDGRPLSLVRCPRGTGEPCFYNKHPGDALPDRVGRVDIEESSGTGEYVYVTSAEGLVALVQVGTLEVHVWGSRADRLERPDQIVMDLDPDEGLEWEAVVEAARETRALLEDAGLESWVKTTGGKGLHVVAPLTRRADFDEVKAFAKAVADTLTARAPDRYTANMSKAKRKGRVFVDYLRNGRGATAIAPWSTRARPGATVSVPVTWDELATVRPDAFRVDTVAARLESLDGDPWEGFFDVRQSVTKAAWAAVGGRP